MLAAARELEDLRQPPGIGPVTPGEVLREELGLSGHALAREIGVPSN